MNDHRIEGDEFVVMMINTTKEQKELIIDKFEQINRIHAGEQDGLPQITVSMGAAHGSDYMDYAELLNDNS